MGKTTISWMHHGCGGLILTFYAVQYISAATLAEILAGPNEAGMGYGRGGNGQRGAGCCNGTCLLGATPASNPGAGPRRSR